MEKPFPTPHMEKKTELAFMAYHHIQQLNKIKNKISVRKSVTIDFAIEVIKNHFGLLADDTLVVPTDASFEEWENERGDIVIKTQRIDEDGNVKDCLLLKTN